MSQLRQQLFDGLRERAMIERVGDAASYTRAATWRITERGRAIAASNGAAAAEPHLMRALDTLLPAESEAK